MKLDTVISEPLSTAGSQATKLEEANFDGLFTYEGRSDPFLPFVPAAASTTKPMLYTNVAVALPRSPFQLAQQAWDLQQLSAGRFALGVGSQIKAHIERRFSASWHPPVHRMRELIEATRSIMASWQAGSPLNYVGRYYTHTLSSPLLTPLPLKSAGPPAVWCAAVGPQMTRMAARTADGIIFHPFCSSLYLQNQAIPIVHEARASARPNTDPANAADTKPTGSKNITSDQSGDEHLPTVATTKPAVDKPITSDQSGDEHLSTVATTNPTGGKGITASDSITDSTQKQNNQPNGQQITNPNSQQKITNPNGGQFTIVCGAMTALWRNEAERAQSLAGLRAQLGFYGSTPSYRVVLEAHGWGDLQPELRHLTRENRWGELGSLWTDEMVEAIAITGTPEQAAKKIRTRYAGIADRISLQIAAGTAPERHFELAACWA